MSGQVEVRGGASVEEVAAVLAVLASCGPAELRVSPYERWRRARQHAVRPVPAVR